MYTLFSDQEQHFVTEGTSQITKNLKQDDYILVIGGSNDIETTEEKQVIGNKQKLIETTQHTNLIMASLPMRHDKPELDLKIIAVNSELEKAASKHGNVVILPLHLLPRHYFSQHGMYLNKKGKKVSIAVANITVESTLKINRDRNTHTATYSMMK